MFFPHSRSQDGCIIVITQARTQIMTGERTTYQILIITNLTWHDTPQVRNDIPVPHALMGPSGYDGTTRHRCDHKVDRYLGTMKPLPFTPSPSCFHPPLYPSAPPSIVVITNQRENTRHHSRDNKQTGTSGIWTTMYVRFASPKPQKPWTWLA